ncbi:MAG: DUF815 domain-containing protein [Pseudomonadota bacterium]
MPDAATRIATELGNIASHLARIADRLACDAQPMDARQTSPRKHTPGTAPAHTIDPDAADAYLWTGTMTPLTRLDALPLDVLVGIDRQRMTLLDNTRRFIQGKPALDALLWGSRGMGKSSLVKAVCHQVSTEKPKALAMVEIPRQYLKDIGTLIEQLRAVPKRFVIFCDDLSFDSLDDTYRTLKTALEGGLAKRPDNVLIYATSNRRHLVDQHSDRATLMQSDQVDESLSLADRFGLWLGFHHCPQPAFEAMVRAHAAHVGLAKKHQRTLIQQANTFARQRGGRSGRIASQFISQLRTRRTPDKKTSR